GLPPDDVDTIELGAGGQPPPVLLVRSRRTDDKYRRTRHLTLDGGLPRVVSVDGRDHQSPESAGQLRLYTVDLCDPRRLLDLSHQLDSKKGLASSHVPGHQTGPVLGNLVKTLLLVWPELQRLVSHSDVPFSFSFASTSTHR